MIWVLIVLMTATVLAVLVRPLMQSQTGYRATHESDMSIYGDQLKELDRERERGLISDADYGAAKTEIERRLLEAGRKRRSALLVRQQKLPAMAIALTIPVIALVLYSRMGQPLMPDFPYAARAMPVIDTGATVAGAGNHQANNGQNQSMEQAARQLAEKLAQNPENPEGWSLLARSYHSIGQFGEAAMAYRKAIEYAPRDAQLYISLGEVLLELSGDRPSNEAVQTFETALEIAPKAPAARFYTGLMAIYADDRDRALALWGGLANDTQPSDPWAGELLRRLVSLAGDMGRNPAEIVPAHLADAAQVALQNGPLPQTPAAAPQPAAPVSEGPGPSAEDIRAAQEMSPDDRMEMIRGMVSQLAEKLEDNPNDPAGWQRLARAYQVLGDDEQAAYALKRLREVTN